MNITSLLDRVQGLLTGEPARAIGYGAALVIIGVVYLANALGITRFGDSMDLATALGLTTAAIAAVATVVEAIRKAVSPLATVRTVAHDADYFGADAALRGAGIDPDA